MAKIISIASAKGGVGKTTVTANLGNALVKLGKKVTVVDSNLTTPHLSLYLGLHPKATINSVLKNGSDLKEAVYSQYSGLEVVPASIYLDEIAGSETVNFRNILEHLQDRDIILLDSAPGLGKESLLSLQASDGVIFVATPHIPSIVDVAKCYRLANSMRIKAIGIVLNRVKGKSYEISKKEVENLIGLPVIGIIPEDDYVLKSTNSKVPVTELNPKCKASESFFKLAGNLIGESYQEPRKGFLGGVFNFFRS